MRLKSVVMVAVVQWLSANKLVKSNQKVRIKYSFILFLISSDEDDEDEN